MLAAVFGALIYLLKLPADFEGLITVGNIPEVLLQQGFAVANSNQPCPHKAVVAAEMRTE